MPNATLYVFDEEDQPGGDASWTNDTNVHGTPNGLAIECALTAGQTSDVEVFTFQGPITPIPVNAAITALRLLVYGIGTPGGLLSIQSNNGNDVYVGPWLTAATGTASLTIDMLNLVADFQVADINADAAVVHLTANNNTAGPINYQIDAIGLYVAWTAGNKRRRFARRLWCSEQG